MRIAVVGARGPAGRRGRPRMRAGSRHRRLRRTPSSTSTDDARGRRGDGARPSGRDRQRRGLQRRRRRRRSSGRRAGRQRVRRARAGARGASASARRSCTTAPISSSTARRRRRIREDGSAESAQRVRGVEAAGRMVRGSTRRARTCCASRACSDARRRARAEGQRRRHHERAARGRPPKVFEDRTVSPTYVIDAARATRELLESRRAGGPVPLRQLRSLHLAGVRAASWRASSASSRA